MLSRLRTRRIHPTPLGWVVGGLLIGLVIAALISDSRTVWGSAFALLAFAVLISVGVFSRGVSRSLQRPNMTPGKEFPDTPDPPQRRSLAGARSLTQAPLLSMQKLRRPARLFGWMPGSP